jgi:hypothetical protein
MNPASRRPLTLALAAIKPGKGRWVTQGRPVPKPRKPKAKPVHAAALPKLTFPDHGNARRIARNDRKRLRQQRRAA